MKNIILLLAVGLVTTHIFSTNIQIDSIALIDQDATADTVRIQFDLSWNHSWRTNSGPANWDAAWVFVKYRENGSYWNHADLNYVDGTNDGHTVPAGATIRTATNGIGCFIYRSTEGAGAVNFTGIELSWDYGAEGIDDDAILDIQIFAIEMVYVPAGSFNLGGGAGTEPFKFYEYPTTTNSYQVNSENAINVGTTNGFLYYAPGSGADGMGPIPAAFPKGYDAFYCMKYEASEEQWISFFNTLDPTQKQSRDITDASGKNGDNIVARNTVSWKDGSSSATSSAPERACGYLSLADIYAYMDWAGLRPLSELEYEKACRGPLETNADEYAWGTGNIFGDEYVLSSSGTSNEEVTNPAVGSGNAAWFETDGSIDGPLRCGIFAASALNKNREETGGTYYGIMEMSGNLRERTVSVGNPTGRAYDGQHGDGVLNASGNSTTNNWPNIFTGEGAGFRGGFYANVSTVLQVSNRAEATIADTNRGSSRGIRGVRTAP